MLKSPNFEAELGIRRQPIFAGNQRHHTTRCHLRDLVIAVGAHEPSDDGLA